MLDTDFHLNILYDIHFTFGLHPTTIHFSDNELDLIHKYYRQIIDSTEFKLLKLLYYSLPKHIKKKYIIRFIVKILI